MAIAAAPAIAEAAPAVVGGSEAATAGSAAVGSKAATKTKAPAPKRSEAPSRASKAPKAESAKKSSEPAMPALGSKSRSQGKKFLSKVGNKKVLLPEMISCLVVLVFGTLVAPKGSKDDVHRMLVKGSALMAVFFVLAIVSTGGKGPQKVANVIGLLVTLSYLLNSSDIHNIVNWVNSFFDKKNAKVEKPSAPSTPSTGNPSEEAGKIAGEIIGGATLPSEPTAET